MTPVDRVRHSLEIAQMILEEGDWPIAQDHLSEAISLLEGKVLVPREATEEMNVAGCRAWMMQGSRPVPEIWSAMVQAAEEE